MLFRTITTIASLLIAILLAAISFRQAGYVAAQIQNQNPNAAVLPLALAIISFLLALVFAMPTMRKNLLVRSYNSKGRILFILLCLGIIAGIAFVGNTIIKSDIPTNIPKSYILPVGGGVIALFFLTFIFPGIAFLELRNAKSKVEVFSDPSVKRYIVPQQIEVMIPHYQQGLVSRIIRPILWTLAILFIGIGLYGTTATRFIPSPDHLDWVARKLPILIAMAVSALGVLVFFSKPEAGKGIFGAAMVQNIAVFLILSAGVMALAKPFFTTGLPALQSNLVAGKTGSQTVVVQSIDNPDQGDGCINGTMATAENAPATAINICGVPGSIRDTLATGDKLTLTGKQTPYGLRYTNIDKSAAEEPTTEQPSNP
ncbi:hypothetical protein [Profundibacter sp.]|uniref:hypothetical protein n=1 Tax=Profundibacter sp. TaxID=3101071 RepID=UPI003D12038C